MARAYLTRSGATVSLDPADFIQQGHKHNTMLLIERVVEYVENKDVPFTRTQCWQASYGHYSAVCATIRSLLHAGLVVIIDEKRSPQWLISVDKLVRWKESGAKIPTRRSRYDTAR